jgi:hypothetical protein
MVLLRSSTGKFQTSAEKKAYHEDQTLVGSELQSIKELIHEMTQDQRARDGALMAAIKKLAASVAHAEVRTRIERIVTKYHQPTDAVDCQLSGYPFRMY